MNAASRIPSPDLMVTESKKSAASGDSIARSTDKLKQSAGGL